MLKERTNSINLSAYSEIGDARICQFYANLNSQSPELMDMGRTMLDPAAYKINRTTVMKDQAEFETYAYALQDELIAAKTPAEGEVNE